MTTRCLVVGGGGREHAIAKAIAACDVVLCGAMSKRNPGIAALCERIFVLKETDVRTVVEAAKACRAELIVVGPEAPLEAGLADAFDDLGITCIGPGRLAARLETDKAFCRAMMERHGIAGCPRYRTFDDAEEAVAFIGEHDGDLVVKPFGLTGGKGVRVMGEQVDRQGAIEYVRQLGGRVVLEERLIGEEFTLQAFSDGVRIAPMPLVQDHKRAYEGDTGPNTGGMGSYSLETHRFPFVTDADYRVACGIMQDAVKALSEEGYPFRGILYGQFMNTRSGPMVVEFNARFGDPEAMNVLPLLASDFLELCCHIGSGTLSETQTRFEKKATVCKYVVPEGYPDRPRAGGLITLGETGDAAVYYANAEERDGRIFTLTSRTLAFVGIGDTLAEAEAIAESAAAGVRGPVYHRRDIGTAALLEKRIAHMKAIR
jgi:phosphoribosylamine--glycine ligase